MLRGRGGKKAKRFNTEDIENGFEGTESFRRGRDRALAEFNSKRDPSLGSLPASGHAG